MTFAVGTFAGALLRIAWIAFVAIHWEETLARRTYQLDSLPRAHLVQ